MEWKRKRIVEWYINIWSWIFKCYKLKGQYYRHGKLEYEGEFLYDKKWNGKGYDENGNIIYELMNGTGKVKEYNMFNGKLEFEGEYLNGKKIEM